MQGMLMERQGRKLKIFKYIGVKLFLTSLK